MKISIRRGHQRTGADGCASAILNEIDVANAYYSKVMEYLRQLGHEVLDVTPPEANRSLGDSLWYGINMSNNWGADLFISCHANNCYDKYNGALGCEVIHHPNSSKGQQYAISIEKEISNLGFKSRGARADVRGLAEINNVNCPVCIIEPFFLEAISDIEVWNRVGADGLARAIVKGITGKEVSNTNITGWKQDNVGWWYVYDNNKNYYSNQWVLINNEWYCFNEKGYAKQSEWMLSKDKTTWYYLKDSCKMAKSEWVEVDDEFYCFDNNGKMYSNCVTPDGYKVDESGAWIR